MGESKRRGQIRLRGLNTKGAEVHQTRQISESQYTNEINSGLNVDWALSRPNLDGLQSQVKDTFQVCPETQFLLQAKPNDENQRSKEEQQRSETSGAILLADSKKRADKGKTAIREESEDESSFESHEEIEETEGTTAQRQEMKMIIKKANELGIEFKRKGRELEIELMRVLEGRNKKSSTTRERTSEWRFRQGV